MPQDAWTFHQRTVGPPLSEFVDSLWAVDGYVQPHSRERVLPTGSMQLVFRVDADGRASSAVAGPRSESFVLDTSRPFSAVGAHFKPGGGFPFFAVPASELHNGSWTLDLLWGAHAATLRDRLWEAATPERRLRLLERELIDRARGGLHRHPAVRYALGAFDGSNGARRVSDVVQRIGISARRLTQLFQSEVGLSPKAFCRVRRFNEALRRVGSLRDVDWADVALSCGYFDQAHFNHDFRAFSGLSPSSYLRHRVSRTHVAIADRPA